jgi:hypothetical protein
MYPLCIHFESSKHSLRVGWRNGEWIVSPFCVLCHIICKNSFPANKVRREYFLRASVSCVTLFRKKLFFCMRCVTSLVKNLPFSNTHCLPSHHLHYLQSIYIAHCIYCCQYTSVDVTSFVASRFSSAVHCMTLCDICRHLSSAFIGRVI